MIPPGFSPYGLSLIKFGNPKVRGESQDPGTFADHGETSKQVDLSSPKVVPANATTVSPQTFADAKEQIKKDTESLQS